MANRNQVPRGEPRSSFSSASTRMYTDIAIASYEIATAGSNEVTVQIDGVANEPHYRTCLEENRDDIPPAPAQCAIEGHYEAHDDHTPDTAGYSTDLTPRQTQPIHHTELPCGQ